VITALLLFVVGTLVGAIGLLFPTSNSTASSSAAADGVGTVMGFASGFSIWLPFGVMGTCAAVLVGIFLIGLTIRLVRIISSYLTGGGGSAA
jgi:hypothetical protein